MQKLRPRERKCVPTTPAEVQMPPLPPVVCVDTVGRQRKQARRGPSQPGCGGREDFRYPKGIPVSLRVTQKSIFKWILNRLSLESDTPGGLTPASPLPAPGLWMSRGGLPDPRVSVCKWGFLHSPSHGALPGHTECHALCPSQCQPVPDGAETYTEQASPRPCTPLPIMGPLSWLCGEQKQAGKWGGGAEPSVPHPHTPSPSSPSLSDFQELDPRQRPNSRPGAVPRRQTGQRAKSGGASPYRQMLGFFPPGFPPLQNGERAPPVGHRGDVRDAPGKWVALQVLPFRALRPPQQCCKQPPPMKFPSTSRFSQPLFPDMPCHPCSTPTTHSIY